MPRGGESARSAAYYEEYAAMGPERSLEKLAHQLYLEQRKERPLESTWLSKLKKASRDYGWQSRVKEYDRAQVEERKRAKADLLERMNEEHALLGRTHALRAAKMIAELTEQNRMSSTAAVTLLKIATDLERVARGAETEITRTIEDQPKQLQHTIAFDLTRLSDVQLSKLEEIAGEIESPDD